MKFPSWPSPIGYRDIKLGLERVEELLLRLGNPHQSLPPVIHIAGTNGKGSTLAYLKAVLENADYLVHSYTSPHLVNFNERIVLAGKEISDEFLDEILEECQRAAEMEPKIEVTFFEGITVAAFLAFSRIKADVVLLETGMGGRLDATNVVPNPILTIITPVSFDHMEFLGNNLTEIAFEKAGIIKEHSTTIIGRQEKSALEVIKKQASEKNSTCFVFGNEWKVSKKNEQMVFEFAGKKIELPLPNLAGDHQIENAGNAIMAMLCQNHFKITGTNLKRGITSAKWPARLQKITSGEIFSLLPKNYQLFVDGAHNEDGAKALANWIGKQNMEEIKSKNKKTATYLICAMLENKDGSAFFKYLSGSTDFVVGMNIKGESKSKSALQIAKEAAKFEVKAIDAASFEEALKYIMIIHEGRGKKNKLEKKSPEIKNPARIIICGSLYLAGQFLEENEIISF